MKKLGRILTDPSHHRYSLWQSAITVLILVSCLSLAVETVPDLAQRYAVQLAWVEWISVAFFTLDYLANLLYSEKRLKYAISFWGIVDLLSILPSFLMLLNLTAIRGAKVLRLIRVARILRVLKLIRTAVGNTKGTTNPLLSNLKIYLILFFSVLMISSTAMYYVEGTLYSADAMAVGQHAIEAAAQAADQTAQFVPVDPISGSPIPEDKRFFTSIPAAMWWSIVTMTTTGYGDLYPVTVGGRIVAGVTMIFGLILFAVLFNLIGKTLMAILFGEKLGQTEDE